MSSNDVNNYLSDLPEAIKSRYPYNEPNKKITLFEGDYLIRINKNEIEITGKVYYSWFPKIGVKFEGVIKQGNTNVNILHSDYQLELIVGGECMGLGYISQLNRVSLSGELNQDVFSGDKSIIKQPKILNCTKIKQAMETSFIKLSRNDAEDVFGRYFNPIPVIEHWKDQIPEENGEDLYQEIKFLLLITKMYINYSSADVREIIQNLCSRYIHDIYLNEDQRRPLSDLKFIGAIIFRHRNIKDYRKLKKFFAEPAHIDKIRYWLFQIGARAEYQASLF